MRTAVRRMREFGLMPIGVPYAEPAAATINGKFDRANLIGKLQGSALPHRHVQ